MNTLTLRDKIIKVGYSKDFTNYMINKCKSLERKWEIKDARHCVIVASAIGKAETNACKTSNNCFWVSKKRYTKKSAFDLWVKLYKSKRQNTIMKDFYWPNNKTHYCTSEHSSGNKKRCPNWLRISQKIFKYLNK